MPESAETAIQSDFGVTPHLIPSLVHNFGWMLRGNLVYAACQWGMIIALAKTGTPEMLGVFSLASAIATPVFMLFNLHLRAVQVTDAKGVHSFREYLTLRLLTTAGAIVTIYLIGSSRGYAEQTFLVIVLVALFKAVEAISEMYYGFLQRRERMDRVAKSLMLKGILALIVFTLVIGRTGSIGWGTASLVLTSIVVLLTYDFHSKALLTRSNNAESLAHHAIRPSTLIRGVSRLAWLALPLGLVMGLISLNLNLPRYFISHSLGEHELGIFAAIAYVIAGASTVIEALGQAASPRLANFYAAGNVSSFRRLSIRLAVSGIAIGFSAVVVAYLGGPQILTVLYSRDYADRADLFFWLMVSTPLLFGATFLSYVITAARYFRAQVPVFLATACVTALACPILLPQYGLFGVAIALLLSAIVQFAGSAAIVFYACTIGIPRPLAVVPQ